MKAGHILQGPGTRGKNLNERRKCKNSPIEELTALIRAEPVEDGIKHVGEQQLANIIAEFGVEDFVNALCDTSLPPSITAGLIRLFARTPPPPTSLCQRLVKYAISAESVEIRDAIVEAVELWEDVEAASIISEHQETVPWLADYIETVVGELRG